MRRLITFIIDMTLIGFAVMPTHLFVMIVQSNLPSGSNGSWQSMEPFDWTGSILFLAALILFEGVVARRLYARRQLHAYDSGNPAARRLAACGVLCGAHGDADRRGVVA